MATHTSSASAAVKRRRSSLGGRLRERTAAAHAEAEEAMDLPTRLATVERYASLLTVLEAFHRACEPVLADVVAGGPASLRDGALVRTGRLRNDLNALGAHPADEMSPSAPELSTVDHRVGAWYVIEGASLGGLVVAGEVGRRLPEARPATTYFRGEGAATAARWREFQSMLAAWESRGEPAAERVVAGALVTFTTLIGRLRGAP